MLTTNIRYTTKLPDGQITIAGVSSIVRLFVPIYIKDEWATLNPHRKEGEWVRISFPNTWQWVWEVDDGTYRGKLPTRIEQFLKKEHGLNMPPSVKSEVGNIGREYATTGMTYEYEFVQTIDWKAGDFGDKGSCFWDANRAALQMIEEHGYAMRFYRDKQGIARAWIIPHLDGYVVFNGYGFASNSTITCANVLAQHLGKLWQAYKVGLSNESSSSGTLYINSGAGYFVTLSPVQVKTIDLSLEDAFEFYCYNCGDGIGAHDVRFSPHDDTLCDYCFDLEYTYCYSCDDVVHREDITRVGFEDYCDVCLNDQFRYNSKTKMYEPK